jgi:hypothetical protein
MIKKIDLNTGRYFSSSFVLFGVVLIGVAGWLFYKEEYIIGIVAVPISIILLTTRKGLEINLSEKFLNEYVQIIGWKKNNKMTLGHLNKILIKRIKVSQTMNSHGGSRTSITDYVYRSYLIMDDEAILIYENGDRKKLINQLKPVSDFLEVTLMDETRE